MLLDFATFIWWKHSPLPFYLPLALTLSSGSSKKNNLTVSSKYIGILHFLICPLAPKSRHVNQFSFLLEKTQFIVNLQIQLKLTWAVNSTEWKSYLHKTVRFVCTFFLLDFFHFNCSRAIMSLSHYYVLLIIFVGFFIWEFFLVCFFFYFKWGIFNLSGLLFFFFLKWVIHFLRVVFL